jgi:DNA polymerase III epsilon subunit-like protein
MNFVVIDTEFNSMRNMEKYCDPNNEVTLKTNYKCPNEIIQIAALKLDKRFRVIDSFDTFIKPVVYDKLNPEIANITGITAEQLETGVSFKDSLELMEAFVDEDSIICSWAKDDAIEFIRNANYHNLTVQPWLNKYIDLQEYCTKILADQNTLGLKRAMARLNVAFKEEDLHNALNDCLYTVEVIKRVFNFKALQRYVIDNVVGKYFEKLEMERLAAAQGIIDKKLIGFKWYEPVKSNYVMGLDGMTA